MLPYFIVIGAQKSASTFLQVCLADHPEVWLPRGETPFFESPDYEASRLSDLELIFRGRRERRLGVKRPNYLCQPEVPVRIRRDLPEAKLIAVLRDPIPRAVSAYFHMMAESQMPLLEVNEGFRRLLRGDLQRHYPRSRQILEYGLYGAGLASYLSQFPQEQILVLFSEELLADKLHSIRDVFTFLDVDPAYEPRTLMAQPQAVVYNSKRIKFLRAANPLTMWYSADRMRAYLRRGKMIRRGIRRTFQAIDRTVLAFLFRNHKPELAPDVRDDLCAYYRDDVTLLRTLVGRIPRSWGV